MRGKKAILLLAILGAGYAGWLHLPRHYNPFSPLSVGLLPRRITSSKLHPQPPPHGAERLPEA